MHKDATGACVANTPMTCPADMHPTSDGTKCEANTAPVIDADMAKIKTYQEDMA